MEPNLVVEGVKFMALGMGTVFLFLILMIFVLNIQAKVINKYFPQQQEPVVKSSKKKSGISEDEEIVAVISASIIKFRS